MKEWLAALAALGSIPYLVGFDASGVDPSPERSNSDASVLDLSAYRLKKFPMAQRTK